MNLDHLTYFKTLVELGSRSETAEHLSITPSTLSLALSKLEQEVGVPLIQKKRGSVELTNEGEAFYEYVEISLRLKLLQEKRGGGAFEAKSLLAWCSLSRAKIGRALSTGFDRKPMETFLSGWSSPQPLP